MIILVAEDFRSWFWGKFEEWRRGTTNGPTAFARYLGIAQYQSVSDWLNGRYKPKSQEHIAKIADKFPDVYEILGLEPPAQPDDDPLLNAINRDFAELDDEDRQEILDMIDAKIRRKQAREAARRRPHTGQTGPLPSR